jgi:hypothetical protein
MAKGAMDSAISGTPEASLFRFVHVQCTRYSIDDAYHPLTGSDKLGSTSNTYLQREGDLIDSIYVVIQLPGIAGSRYKDRCGMAAIENITLSIGNQPIDHFDSLFLMMSDALNGKAGKKLKEQVGRDAGEQADRDRYARTLYVPIPFYFNRHCGSVSGLALPLIGLQFHQVQVSLKLKSIGDLIVDPSSAKLSQPVSAIGNTSAAAPAWSESSAAPTNNDARVALQVGYVYLGTEERQRFSTLSAEVLIRQMQVATKTTSKVANQQIRLYFNHPVNQILVAARKADKGELEKEYGEFDLSGLHVRDSDYRTESQKTAGTVLTDAQHEDQGGMWLVRDPLASLQLRFNNHPRLNMGVQGTGAPVEASYFRTVASHQGCNLIPDKANGEFIYPINFALDCSNWAQPSGSVNMSRIDNCVLEVGYADQSKAYETMVYCTSYNILKFKNGMAGLAFSN